MDDGQDWACSDCGTLIDGPETRKCPNCGGINFYPLADEVPGDTQGTERTIVDTEKVVELLERDEES